MPYAAEEVGPYVQAKRVDKKREPESFGVVKHPRIDIQANVSGKDSYKKNKGNTQRYSPCFDFSKGKSHGDNQGYHHNGLHRGMYIEEFSKPFHTKSVLSFISVIFAAAKLQKYS